MNYDDWKLQAPPEGEDDKDDIATHPTWCRCELCRLDREATRAAKLYPDTDKSTGYYAS